MVKWIVVAFALIGLLHFVRFTIPEIFGWLIFPADTKVEVRRVPSPDGKVDAVLLKTLPNGDYETYQVYLVPAGSKRFEGESPAHQEIVPIVNAFAGGLEKAQFRWIGPDLLEIDYPYACIAEFSNHWCSHELDGCKRKVAVRLRAPDDTSPHLCEPWSSGNN